MNSKLFLSSACAMLCAFQEGWSLEPSPPRKVAPEIGIAIIVNDQTIEITRFAKRQSIRKSILALPPNIVIKAGAGALEPMSTVEIVEVVEAQTTQYLSKAISCFQVDGARVSIESLKVRLAMQSPVILARHGDEIDSQFLKLFTPETLIVVIPSSSNPSKSIDSRFP